MFLVVKLLERFSIECHKTKTKVQWNPDITICQGSSGIRSLYRDSRYNDIAVK